MSSQLSQSTVLFASRACAHARKGNKGNIGAQKMFLAPLCAQCSSWLVVGVKTLPSSGFPLSNPLLSAGRAVPTVLYVEQLRKAPQKTPPHLEEVQLIHITWVWATRGSKSPTESKSCV